MGNFEAFVENNVSNVFLESKLSLSMLYNILYQISGFSISATSVLFFRKKIIKNGVDTFLK